MYLYMFTSTAWKFICTVCSTVSSSVNVMLWTKFKYKKGINSLGMQKRVMVLVQCNSPHSDKSINEVSKCYLQ